MEYDRAREHYDSNLTNAMQEDPEFKRMVLEKMAEIEARDRVAQRA